MIQTRQLEVKNSALASFLLNMRNPPETLRFRGKFSKKKQIAGIAYSNYSCFCVCFYSFYGGFSAVLIDLFLYYIFFSIKTVSFTTPAQPALWRLSGSAGSARRRFPASPYFSPYHHTGRAAACPHTEAAGASAGRLSL